MRIAALALGMTATAFACGGKVVTDGSSSGASGTGAPTSTITFPSPGNDTPPSPTSGPSPGRPPSPDGARYTAQAWPGGLDHVEIFKADVARDLCVHLHLAYTNAEPGTGRFPGMKVPPGWSVQSADKSRGARSCGFGERKGETTAARDVSGSVSWPATSGRLFPCWLDVDATLAFPDGTTETMASYAVDVVGGC